MKQTQLLLFNRLCSTLSPFRTVSRAAFGLTYCTTTTTTSVKDETEPPKQNTLYRRITPFGNPDVSVVPVLDQWVQENRNVNEAHMRFVIRELRHYRRFTHALEVSKWMSEKRSKLATAADIATRLDLIAIVHGVEEAENYFNTISEELRTLEVYGALLNYFAHTKCVDKAEGVMQTMKDLGFARYTLSYNVMLNLYSQTGNREKFDAMLNEMEAKKIKFDSHTYSILLNAYGDDNDIDGVEKTLIKMESDDKVVIDWKTYTVAAEQFLRAELIDKALEALRKSEKLVGVYKKKNEAYSSIITLYASAGKKEEVLRVWEECKKCMVTKRVLEESKKCKVTNRDYISFLPSVLKFNDIESAEKAFEEWQESHSPKDIRIPNFLIRTYCVKGMIEKAEALLETVKLKKWQAPDSFTWYWMSYGYVKCNQMSKAVEAVELALSEFKPQVYSKARQEAVAACIKYLKDEGDLERLNAIIESLKEKCAISAKIHGNLIDYVSGRCDIEDVFEGNEMEVCESSRATGS